MEAIERYKDFLVRPYRGQLYCGCFSALLLWREKDIYLLAGDEVVVTKAGKKTYGIDRFFSSLYGKSVSGLSFFALSLISVKERHSFPMSIEQTVLTKEEKKITTEKQKKKKKYSGKPKNKGGRPKGSKNKNKMEVDLNPELLRIKGWIQALLKQLGTLIPVTYLLRFRSFWQ